MTKERVAQAIRDGDLDAARAMAVAAVKAKPGDVAQRALLFQILAVQGDWARAEAQLDMIGTLDAGALSLVSDYKGAIAAEKARAHVMAGVARPAIFGKPERWLAHMVEALRLDGLHSAAAAYDMRCAALEAATASPGMIDGAPFAWIMDADHRFGPVLECVLNGDYHWVPFSALSRLTLEKPHDLRDLVWAIGVAEFVNGGSWPIFAFARYPDSGIVSGGDAAHALGRRTDWRALHDDHYAGLGQRMYATESADAPFLEMRSLSFENAPTPARLAPEDAY